MPTEEEYAEQFIEAVGKVAEQLEALNHQLDVLTRDMTQLVHIELPAVRGALQRR